MSTRKGQAASVTLLRREQLRSASAPTNTSEVRQKIEEAGGQGRPPLQEVRWWTVGGGPMSTRKGQAASVTLLRREQLRSASAPTNTSDVRRKTVGRQSLSRLRRQLPLHKGAYSLRRGLLCQSFAFPVEVFVVGAGAVEDRAVGLELDDAVTGGLEQLVVV